MEPHGTICAGLSAACCHLVLQARRLSVGASLHVQLKEYRVWHSMLEHADSNPMTIASIQY